MDRTMGGFQKRPYEPGAIAILGAGRSGRGALRLARARGLRADVFDACPAPGVSDRLPGSFGDYATVVLSPGFAAEHPWRLRAEAECADCVGEPTFAARFWRGSIYGVTGTNGKTTVTRLIAEALNQAGVRAVPVGNIGRPLSEWIVDGTREARASAVVCELSSYQAERCSGLLLDGLVWTNFAEDHLDRYGSMRDYFEAKARLFSAVRPGVPVVVGASVPDWARSLEHVVPGHLQVVEPTERSVYWRRLPETSPFRRRPHSNNLVLAERFLAALGRDDGLAKAAARFSLSPHRLSEVCRIGAVSFWDDSKATNFASALAAVESFREPVFWVGGGAPKGGDVAGFVRRLGPRVEAAYLYGAAQHRHAGLFHRHCPHFAGCAAFTDAVRAAAKAALGAGRGVVLLSPGFASFDQFRSYEERGKCFTTIVLGLKDGPRKLNY